MCHLYSPFPSQVLGHCSLQNTAISVFPCDSYHSFEAEARQWLKSHFTDEYTEAHTDFLKASHGLRPSSFESQNPAIVNCSTNTGGLSVRKDQERKARAEGKSQVSSARLGPLHHTLSLCGCFFRKLMTRPWALPDGVCYRLNCVPQPPIQFICWSPNPQCDYIWRQGL